MALFDTLVSKPSGWRWDLLAIFMRVRERTRFEVGDLAMNAMWASNRFC